MFVTAYVYYSVRKCVLVKKSKLRKIAQKRIFLFGVYLNMGCYRQQVLFVTIDIV